MRVVEGDGEPRDVEAVEGLLIGRHSDCGLTLSDDYASERHATIVKSGSLFAIVDLGSENGTWVNGSELLMEGQERVLEDGLRIVVGEVAISFLGIMSVEEPADESNASLPNDAPTTLLETWKMPKTDHAALDETVLAVSPFQRPTQQQERQRQDRRQEDRRAPGKSRSRSDYVVRASESSFDEFDERDPRTIVADSDQRVASAVRLTSMGARLVIVNEADLRIVPVDQAEFTVGRSEDSAVRLQNRGVSLVHARLRFRATGNTFILEDAGSVNGTLVDGAPLLEGVATPLESDMHLRLGTIEAVFMQSLDSDFCELPASRHDDAIKLLKSRGKLSTQAIKLGTVKAQEEGMTLGEALLLAQSVTPRDWCRAIRDARLAMDLGVLTEPRFTPRAILVAAAVLVATVLVATVLIALAQ